MIHEGEQAPDFELASDTGERVRLSAFRGRPVVLYFYPRDDTPGCTVEACGFRDVYERFADRGAVVFGVSPDTETSHAEFRAKYRLPFALLADPEHEAADAYGVSIDRTTSTRKSRGIRRSTFVIAPDGRILRAMRGVRPAGHAEEVVAALP
ncbi:MAG: peroxiredoxin [Actinomycetota bacterium]|nr:peroxiredoxin [Actinomycetota bacterium]